MAHVVILGGGFGGLAAAHELRGLLDDGDEVTLVDRNDTFFMGFAKLWDLAGVRPLAEGSVSLTRLADRGVRFVQADITSIDPERRVVETSDGSLEADALLVALGAGPSPAHVDLLRGDGAHDLYDAAALPAMHRDLDAVDGGRIVVSILGGPIKCPPAPFEAALLIDERMRERGVRDDVEIVMSTPQAMTIPVAGPDASRYVADHLAERGIELLSEHAVRDVDAGARRISFQDGPDVEYRLFFGVPATAPPPVLKDSGLGDDQGFVRPDPSTFRTSFDRVYAVGDCTTVPTAKAALPKAGVFAAGEARVAAANIAADLGRGEGATFDGHGFCFLELPGRKVAFVEGNFYGDPPDVHITEADDEQFERKQAYERERLGLWLGA
ncbi:MAG TPA: FAD-dependent oxidoreductase [Acidimicrobiia bacterium]|nr:FAD-dependent oxidoreductase [Acidimicrobiia bacterium]